MTDFFIPTNTTLWTRVNVEEDEMSAFAIPSMDQALRYVFALQNYRKITSHENCVEGWAEVWKILFSMLQRFPEKNDTVVPFVFVTRLSLEMISKVMNATEKSRFDETTYPSWVNRNALHYLFQLARKIDREPEKYMFGFIYSTSEDSFLPLCENYYGMLRNAKFDDALEELTPRIHIPEECLSENQPEKTIQQKDGVVIIRLLSAKIQLSKQIAKKLEEGLRGRLLIQFHSNGAVGSFQPLDEDLIAYLKKNTNPHDHTLEWIQKSDVTQQMVVTVKEDYSASSPQRTYLIMQPWKVDKDFFTQENHTACKNSCCDHN